MRYQNDETIRAFGTSKNPNIQRASRYAIIAAATCFTLAWLWPFHTAPWATFEQESLCFIALIILIPAILTTKTLKAEPAVFGLLALSATPALQLQLGILRFTGDAWLATSYLVAFCAAVFSGYNIAQAPRARDILTTCLASAFTIAAIASTWIALRQWFGLADSIYEINLSGSRPFGNLAQPNNLATLLCLALASILYFFERRMLSTFSAGLLTLFLIAGVTITQSRTPWLVCGVFLVFWDYKEKTLKPRLTLTALTCWTLLYALCVILLPITAKALMLHSVDLVGRATSLQRLELWDHFITAILSSPALGYGWNQISSAQLANTSTIPAGMMATYSHNLILDILLWTGPFAGIIIIGSLGAWLIRLNYCANDIHKIYSLLAAGIILTHSMVEFPHSYAYFLIPLGLFLGIASTATARFSLPIKPYVVTAAGAAGLLLLAQIAVEYKTLQRDQFAYQISSAKVKGFPAENLRNIHLLTHLRALQNLRRTTPIKMTQEEIKNLEHITERFPYLANLYKIKLISKLSDTPKKESDYLELIRKLHGEAAYEQAKQN